MPIPMHTRWSLPVALLGLALGPLSAAAQPNPPAARADRLGDPLPDGAVARLGTPRLRHGAGVQCLTFDPDGVLLASGGDDRVVRLWEVATGKEVQTFRGHTQRINTVAYSPDGRLLASAGWGGDIRLWDVLKGTQVRTFQTPKDPDGKRWVFSVAFAPDGKTLASGGVDGVVRLWEVATGKEQRALPGHQFWIACVAFSPDGNRSSGCGSRPRARNGRASHSADSTARSTVWPSRPTPGGWWPARPTVG